MANRPFLTSLTLYVFRVFSLPLLKPACRSDIQLHQLFRKMLWAVHGGGDACTQFALQSDLPHMPNTRIHSNT